MTETSQHHGLDWLTFVERVGRLFYTMRLDTVDIAKACHVDEPTAVRALHQYQGQRRAA